LSATTATSCARSRTRAASRRCAGSPACAAHNRGSAWLKPSRPCSATASSDTMYASFGKRALDLIAAAGALLVLSPLLLLVALLIRVFDPGPAIFRQQRVGKDGTPFTLYKFRSMPVNTGDIPSAGISAV